MKYLKKILFSGFAFNIILSFLIFAEQPLFQLNESDLNGLNLKDDELQEFKQFIEALNNLPPQDQEFLKQLGQDMEKQMKEKGLDPNNFEDVAKWMETQPGMGIPPEKSKPEVREPKKSIQVETKPVVEKPTLIQVTNPTNAKSLLNELLRYLSLIRQKVSRNPELAHKLEIRLRQEISELIYFLNILSKPELLAYLTSKDFSRLYKNLELLHQQLASQEPLIAAQEQTISIEDDPYEELQLPYNATQQEIRNAYKEFEREYSPATITRQLDEEGITDKRARNKRIKEASIKLSFIKDAYSALSNQQMKAITDRNLKSKIEKSRNLEQTSVIAFNKIIDALTTAFYPHQILADIKNLLAKHRPQELAQAQQQLEIEKRVLERSKQHVRIPQTPKANYEERPYEQFYQHMARENMFRVPFPSLNRSPLSNYNNFNPPTSTSPLSSDSGLKSKPDHKKNEGKDKDKGIDNDKEKEKDKGLKQPKAEAKEEFTEKDAEKSFLIDQLAQVLESGVGINDEVEIAKMPTRSLMNESEESEKAEPKKIKFNQVLADLNKQLTRAPSRSIQDLQAEKQDLEALRAFGEKNNFDQVFALLQKLAPGQNKKISNSSLQKKWKDKIFDKYGNRLKGWYESIYQLLSPTARHNKGQAPINVEKIKLYGLNLPEKELWEKEQKKKDDKEKDKSKEEEPAQEFEGSLAFPLNAYRDVVNGIYSYFNNINSSFGLKEQPKETAQSKKSNR